MRSLKQQDKTVAILPRNRIDFDTKDPTGFYLGEPEPTAAAELDNCLWIRSQEILNTFGNIGQGLKSGP